MDTISLPERAALRMHCSHAIVTSDGVDGVARVVTALCELGYRVRDFTADVREGVVLSSLTCTVSLAPDECGRFAEQLLGVPSVVSVERC